MLIKLQRGWFSPDGVLYQKGVIEFNGDVSTLPSDALIVSEKGTFPVRENTPKAGFGAKPLEEQVLDLIPGAGKTHQLDLTSTSAPVLSEAERKAKEEELAKEKAADDKADAKDQEKALAEQKAEVEAGLKNAEKAAEKVEQVTDPLAGLKKK